MQCADITAKNSLNGSWIIAKAIFNGSVKGTVTLVKHLLFLTKKKTD